MMALEVPTIMSDIENCFVEVVCIFFDLVLYVLLSRVLFANACEERARFHAQRDQRAILFVLSKKQN